jgi:pimeloyl-ACP methyl ester carboxylesterase
VLAPDLPGHSQSTARRSDSVEAIADWLLALLDAAGVDEAALVGHSMGSLIALEAAARAPARVARLVMVGTAYPMAVSPALLEAAEHDPFAAIDSVNALSISTLAGKPSYPGPGRGCTARPHPVAPAADGAARRQPVPHRLPVCDRYRGGLEAAARVTCPTTLVLGARDQMTWPKHASALAEALRARVVTLPTGPLVMSEAPDALLAGACAKPSARVCRPPGALAPSTRRARARRRGSGSPRA